MWKREHSGTYTLMTDWDISSLAVHFLKIIFIDALQTISVANESFNTSVA